MERVNRKTSNIVVVAHFTEDVINTLAVFQYMPIYFLDVPCSYKKAIPDFGVGEQIYSLRHGKNGCRGIRESCRQMQNIVSADIFVNVGTSADSGKVVHCKLSSRTCHVTGAKSFEQGERAIKIFLGTVMKTQRCIDDFRLSGNRKDLYSMFYEEFSSHKINEMCEELKDTNTMLCKRPVEFKKIETANGVYEFKIGSQINIVILCYEARKKGYCVDYVPCIHSKVLNLSILSEIRCDGEPFYHRAIINVNGSVRQSSSCSEDESLEGYEKILQLLYKVQKLERMLDKVERYPDEHGRWPTIEESLAKVEKKVNFE